MNEPGGLSYDGLDCLYIADTNNHCIQKLNIDTYEMTKLDLEMPKSAESYEEEVDSSKASHVFKVSTYIPKWCLKNFSIYLEKVQIKDKLYSEGAGEFFQHQISR